MRATTDLLHETQDLLQQVRTTHPLVQCLTNSVTPKLMANVLIAVGASPAMVDIPREAGEFAAIASGVVINLGTPHAEQREAMLEAANSANAAGTPWVLDPVAVGALSVRTELAQRLTLLRPGVVRGNASEIRALAGLGAGGQGVDSLESSEDAVDAATELSRACGAVVAVSGAVDIISDGSRVVRIANGDPLLTQITGAGCALGAVVAAFAGVTEDRMAATVAGCAVYAIAAELAAETARGPGSFEVALIDALSGVTAADIAQRGRIS